MAEHPVMDSAIETQSESIAPTPKPLNTQGEAAEALKNLLNLDASKTQETASEESTERGKPIPKRTPKKLSMMMILSIKLTMKHL
jgi:hypothetical protein